MKLYYDGKYKAAIAKLEQAVKILTARRQRKSIMTG